MTAEGGRKRQAMAGASGAIEEAYRQGLAAHALKHNKVRLDYPRIPCTKRSGMHGTPREGKGGGGDEQDG